MITYISVSTVDDTVLESKSGFFDLLFFSFGTGESGRQESLASISTIFNENCKIYWNYRKENMG